MVPKNLRYADSHEWASVEGDVCTVGITQFAVEQLTEVNGTLAFGPPKTAAGRRRVALPAFLADLLKGHLAKHAEPGPSGLVFPASDGGPMRRSNFRRRHWEQATRRAGLDGLRFHDLRHTAVALAIEAGAHPRALMEHLGHSSVNVTLGRYGHLLPGQDEAIAARLETAFHSAHAPSVPAR